MTGSLLFFLAYQGFALLLCVWAAVTALENVREHDGAHRAWTLLAAVATPLVFAGHLVAHHGGPPGLLFVELLVPACAFAVTFVNVATLHGQGLLLKLVHFPVFAWNAAITGIYALRILQSWLGVDLGASLVLGHGMLQDWVGQRGAPSNPVWLHMPLLLPLWLRYRAPHEVTLLTSSAIAGVLLTAFTLRMPVAHPIATGHGEVARAVADNLLPARGLGIALGRAERLDARAVDKCTELLAQLEPTTLTVHVACETAEQPARLDALNQRLATLRQGRELTVVMQPPKRFLGIPARDLSELASAMAKAHWLAAERLAPELLVVFDGPFGSLARYTAAPPTLDHWQTAIGRAADDVRQANRQVKVAVSLDHPAPHTRELFQWLVASKSPIDVAGFSLNAGSHGQSEFATDLEVLEHWAGKVTCARPLRIFFASANPLACGGDLGQWGGLAATLRLAQRASRIEAVCVGPLLDGTDGDGLTTRLGRPRLALRELHRVQAGDSRSSKAKPAPAR